MSARILVMRAGALGDFILGLPALRALRQAFPDSQLELIAPRAVLPLVPPLVDSVVAYELAENAAFFGDAPLPAEMAERYSGLDLAVLWMADSDGAARRQFERLGAKRILWAPALPPKDARVHATDYLMGTLAGVIAAPDVGAGGPAGPPRLSVGILSVDPPSGRSTPGRAATAGRPYIAPASEAASRAGEMLRALGFSPDERLVAVHPGSGGRWKCWPAERFAHVVDLLRAAGLAALLIQGPADEDVIDKVLRVVEGDPPPVVSALAVQDLASLLSLCSCYLGNDSGVTHLAAAVGTPTVALFGPTDPAVWGPRGENVTVIRGGGGSLEAVSVDRVVEAVWSSRA